MAAGAFLLAASFSGTASASALSEETQMVYSGRLFDTSGSPYISETISMRLTIQSGSCLVYQKIQDVTTDEDGHFTIMLSKVTAAAGPSFPSGIDPQVLLASTSSTAIACYQSDGSLATPNSMTPSDSGQRVVNIDVRASAVDAWENVDSQVLSPYFQAKDTMKLAGRLASEYLLAPVGAAVTSGTLMTYGAGVTHPLVCPDDQYLKGSSGVLMCSALPAGGAGSVTSVGLAMPPDIFSVANSPVTANGELRVTFQSQTQNLVFASQDGSDGEPGFRGLVADDLPTIPINKIDTTGGTLATAVIPNLDAAKITSGVLGLARGGLGIDASAVTDGKVLIGSGSTLGLGSVTGVSGVSVSYSTGVLQISGNDLLTAQSILPQSLVATTPNEAVPVALIAATGVTSVDISLSPKGTGALLRQVPDGAVAGGDKRGANAVDWQGSRSASTQVASGDYSVIAGGANNTALGQYSFAANRDATASTYAQTSFGRFNETSAGSANAWVATDPLFVIGNGSSGFPNNAVTVLKNGNVGIGTSAPTARMTIFSSFNNSGTDIRTDTSGLDVVNINSTVNDYALLRLSAWGGVGAMDGNYIQSISKNNNDVNLAFGKFDSTGTILEAMRIDNDGKIGIGTTAPEGNLHVYSKDTDPSAIHSPAVKIQKQYDPTANATAGNESLTVRMTTAVNAFNYATSLHGIVSETEHVSSGDVDDTYGVLGRSFTNGPGKIIKAYGVFGQVYTSGNSATRIVDAAGVRASVKTVAGTIANAYGVFIEPMTGTIDKGYGIYIDAPTGSLDSYAIYSTAGKSYLGGSLGVGVTNPSEKLEVNGTVKATAFLSTSDRRLKSDIQPIRGLSAIRELQGVQYRWKKDGTPDAGVIAQEVEAVFPDAVRTNPEGFKAVKYQYLIAPLIEATKDLDRNQSAMAIRCEETAEQLRSRIEDLERKNQMLEKTNQRLEERLSAIEKALDVGR